MTADELELEFTSPIRCYNGDFDSKTQRVLDAQEGVLREIRKMEPEAHVTYFPCEEKYEVHVWGRSLSGGWHNTRGSALASALGRLL